jgi:hypothetical protein
MRVIDGVQCYGKLTPTSNFYIVCEDEGDDGDWIEGNPNHPNFVFGSWEQVVATLKAYWEGDIIEIGAM